jgi:glycyl-tRNA synthetase (class II)
MVEPLSQQLYDLSVHAKKAEDAATAAQKEARDKIMARREQARAAAKTATEKVNQKIKSAENTATANWNAFKAKVSADIDGLKTMAAEHKQERDANRAENTAERLEWEAGVAIDYAIACVEQAEVAVLDAIAGRSEAEAAKARR